MRVNTSLIQKHKKNIASTTLGPVDELESHVHPEWWRYIFNSLYIKTDADVVEDDEITKYETDLFLKILNVPKGAFILDVADGDFLKHHFKPRSWEWINKKHFVCRERCISANGKKLISREVITHTDKGVIADQFYAENLYSVNSLKLLVEQAGFV